MTSANVTRSELTLSSGGARTYTDAVVKASIQQGGSNLNGLPFNVYAKYARTAFIPDVIHEGDRITDANYTMYDVHNTDEIWWLDAFIGYQCELFRLKTATLKTLTLGARDATTGWPRRSYAESTITLNLAAKGASTTYTGAGFYGKYDYTAVSSALIYEGDIVTINGVDYDVTQSTPYPTKRTDGFCWTVCYLTKREFALRPSTSGTWHLDSESIKTDPRNRIKTWLDQYLDPDNIDGDYISMFALPQGEVDPVTRSFLTENLDLIIAIDKITATADLAEQWDDTNKIYKKVPYAFNESMPIQIYAVNKAGLTASNLTEQVEQEIRRVLTTYPHYKNIRFLDRIDHKPQVLGNVALYSSTVTVRYRRTNDEYTNSGVTITYGTNPTVYTIPNIIKSNLPLLNNDNFTRMPGRLGQYPFLLGSDSLEVTFTIDLDMGDWKRTQGSSTKTDTVNFQVFLDIMGSAGTQAYQTLDLGWASFPVRLIKMEPSFEGSNHLLTLTFKEYNATPGSSTYTTRWSIS